MKRIWVLAIVMMAGGAHAQSSSSSSATESKVKIEDVKPDKNKTAGQDVDEEITNKKMRAESGSKSKLSISNTVQYNGGTIEKPLDEHRPNITNGTDNTAFAAISDLLAAKYNLTAKHSVSAGLGVRMITPFNSDKTPTNLNGSKYNGTKTDAYDPYAKYQYIYKWAGVVQSVFSVTPTWVTRVDSRRNGLASYEQFQQNNVIEIGHTKLSAGLLVNAQISQFDNNDPALLGGQADYAGGLYPFLEYTINDRFNVRTISGVLVYDHLRNEPRVMSYYQEVTYQSLGLGISVTRDVFLYPNVQFIPEDIRADRTNVALSAYINLF